MKLTHNSFVALFSFVSLLTLVSCDPDDSRRDGPFYYYQLALDNQSDEAITITGYRTRDLGTGAALDTPLLLHSVAIAPASRTAIDNLTMQTQIEIVPFIYPGFENNVDSLVVKFGNTNRGYYALATETGTITTNWIPNRASLLELKKVDLVPDGNVLLYRFSQQNADDAEAF